MYPIYEANTCLALPITTILDQEQWLNIFDTCTLNMCELNTMRSRTPLVFSLVSTVKCREMQYIFETSHFGSSTFIQYK
jgi:hypothetical protein